MVADGSGDKLEVKTEITKEDLSDNNKEMKISIKPEPQPDAAAADTAVKQEQTQVCAKSCCSG